tara:strand:- start:311 stop:817 length:507 start_codon:yes stop_codon:yes gene_type:complete
MIYFFEFRSEKFFYLLSYRMPKFAFNKTLWNAGRKIEDDALPKLNEYFNTNFERNENDIFDILDFKDEEKKIIVEVKGRFNTHDKYEDTIITASKVMAGQQAIDEGYKVYFLFVFTDCSKMMELKEDSSFKVRFTGTNCIKHYLIPVAELDDFDNDEPEIKELEPEPE